MGDVTETDGARLRALVLGTTHTSSAANDPMSAEFVELALRNVWDGVWARDGLELRDRSLATINLLIATGHSDELALHFRGALRNGWWTSRQLFEICLHSAGYCGFPAAREALCVLARALSESGGEGA